MKVFNAIVVIAIAIAGLGGAYYFVTANRAEPVGEDEHGHAGGHEEQAQEADVHGHAEEGGHDEEGERGPHGGRMLHGEGLELEITIFETGVPPEFRVYPYADENPLPPDEVQLTILLHRLGGRTDSITFSPEDDFLKSNQEVEEPHSFDVEVNAEHAGKPFTWSYESYEGRVEISEEAAREGGIETQPAGPGTIRDVVALPGEIQLNPNRIVHVVPRLPGLVREVHKNLGDTVKKGDLLAVIDSRELADAKSAFLADLERRELARVRSSREKDLFDKKISSEEEFLTARQALAELDVSVRSAEQKLRSLGLSPEQVADIRGGKDKTLTDYPIHSSIDGTIIEKHMSIGEAVADNADAFVIADLSSLWAEVVVYAADLKRIRENQPVTVHSQDLGIEAQGVIAFVGALVGEQTRTAKAIVDLPNPEGLWRPGLFVTVTVAGEESSVPVAVPVDAIQTFRDWSVAFVSVGNTYEARPVEQGRSDGSLVEIVSGLSPGELFVSKNSYLIKADIEKAGAAHDH
ncbi:MAG: hypothetical protein AMXMBFR84_27850 [Candidatus Hydrogenedentota bacterium]